MTWTDEHGPDELYAKFCVFRVKDGEPLGADEFIFVLRPESDQAAVDALYAYADFVEHRAPNLADQMRLRLDAVVRTNT